MSELRPQAATVRREAARGLATVALLKVFYDRGKGHVDMFMPFIVDAIGSFPSDSFATAELRTHIERRAGLDIPEESLKTLLARATKQRVVRRESGRYFRASAPVPSDSLRASVEVIQREHAKLATALREYAARAGLVVADEAASLDLLMRFLEDHHVSVCLLDVGGASAREGSPLSPKEVRVVARFVNEVATPSPTFSAVLTRMLEGYVLQNALLLRDISGLARKLTDLEVFLDTGVILKLVGLEGENEQAAVQEGVGLLREVGARLAVFEGTLHETRGILSVCEDRLRTAEGMRTLWLTNLTRHLVTNRMTPSDVRQQAALLEERLTVHSVRTKPFPAYRSDLTLEERDLEKRLMRGGQEESDGRVDHDVRCVSAILMLRKGRRSARIEESTAVFATHTQLVADNVRRWYAAQDQSGISPVLHYRTVFNYAWLRKPNAKTRMKLHELAAVCAALARPSREVWEAFLRELRRLHESGSLSSDESVAILASDLLDRELARAEEEDLESDATTIPDVIERVRSSLGAEAEARIACIKEKHSAELSQIAAEAEMAVESRKAETASAISERDVARREREALEKESREKDERLLRRAHLGARVSASVVVGIIGCGIALGVVLGSAKYEPDSIVLRWTSRLLGAGLVVYTVWNVFTGGSMSTVRTTLQRRLQTRLYDWLRGR